MVFHNPKFRDVTDAELKELVREYLLRQFGTGLFASDAHKERREACLQVFAENFGLRSPKIYEAVLTEYQTELAVFDVDSCIEAIREARRCRADLEDESGLVLTVTNRVTEKSYTWHGGANWIEVI